MNRHSIMILVRSGHPACSSFFIVNIGWIYRRLETVAGQFK
jgi:hypothetical protein